MVREGFATAGVPIHLHLVKGRELEATLARVATGASRVVIGGGDGTLGNAAAILAKAGSAMAILPLGTRNHLARQLDIPLELPAAIEIAAAGRTLRIDLGKAGSQIFVNNASVGLYSRLVRSRDAMRGPKWFANLPAAIRVLRNFRSQTIRLSIEGQMHMIDTPLLFIGNNRYMLERGRIGERETLSAGELSFYALAAHSPLKLVLSVLRTLMGSALLQRDFCALEVGRTGTIEGSGGLQVTCDGEPHLMGLPLEISVLSAALEVIVP
jgi:diacylglycerol kinase family enzyme